MTKTKANATVQGAGSATNESNVIVSANAPVENAAQAIARFGTLSGGHVTKAEATEIFSLGIFEEAGVEVTTKMLDKEFWFEHKGQDMPFIAQNIHTEEEGRNGSYDVATGTMLIDGDPCTVSIPQTVITSTIKNNGLGAYVIKFKGEARGKENNYLDFSINLKRLFNS